MKESSYPINPKADPHLNIKIWKWKETGNDEFISGIIEILDTTESHQQIRRDTEATEITIRHLVAQFYTFDASISKITRFLELNPAYLHKVELSRQMLPLNS